ncbi:hypothetical protein [Hyphomicrobium sp.]|uniref:hypothetical protein n=1 Tax=Hyphomicrobium sp. TaxID=82 RepID=UPI003F6ED8B7
MFFTEEQIVQLAEDYAALDDRYNDLRQAYINHPWVTDRGREFGVNGFARRLQCLRRCIHNVFENLPPELAQAPDRDTRHDAELQIQAFVFHAFGAADNLAWIWVSERNITRNNGTPLPDGAIGIRKQQVIPSFSEAFRAHLQDREEWFDYLENFRHALAHRIPLYIPPYVVTQANVARYNELQAGMNAAIAAANVARYNELEAQQMLLTSWQPLMQHSFIEEAGTIVFHSQLIADFNTIHELGSMMLEELGD